MRYSIKNQIKLFWKYSELNQLYKFDYDAFFWEFKIRIYKKLAGHGQLTLDDYIEHQKKFYNIQKVKYLEYKSHHTGFEEKHIDILRNIFFYRFHHFKEKFRYNERYKNLTKIYKLLNQNNLSKTDKILLVDRCIHAQHNSGNICNLNIDKLRIDFIK